MDAQLVIIGGKADKSQVSVTLPAVIGRSREADLTVAHPMISRKHCELYEVDGLVMIRDLGSLNGTFVGHTQVSEGTLHPDAEFTIGPLTFRIEYEYVGEIAPPPEVGAIAEATQPLGTESGSDVADFDVDEETPAFEAAEDIPDADVEETLTVDIHPASEAEQPAIAPPDGALPDFSAWEAGHLGPSEQKDAGAPPPPPVVKPPPAAAEPPAAPPQDEATGSEQAEQTGLAETLDLGKSEAADEQLPAAGEQPTPEEMPDSVAPPESESDESGQERLSDDEKLNEFFKGFQ